MKEHNYIKTSLYKQHEKLNAKIVPFAGYLMPVNYEKGISSEYESVRKSVGMFDVSHMGFISVSGEKSSEFLNYITINNVNKISSGCAQYSVICNESGGTIDDIIIYKRDEFSYFLIVNASNIAKDCEWLVKQNKYNVDISNNSDNISILAVQGPNSRQTLINAFNVDIKNLEFYKFITHELFGSEIIISRTGYTGELGYEILADHKTINKIWSTLLDLNVAPCGLGVRDILRIEMKYCLYGHELNNSINPINAGLNWVLDKDKSNFIGKKNIENEINFTSKRLICFKMIDRAIPRENYVVYKDDTKIGYVSSGAFSIGLKQGIGLAFIDSKLKFGSIISIEIRKKILNAEIIKPPFINNFSLHS